ncbi:TMEM175 family protein [Pedobacter sp. BMA]|uniref:TMEM175 family protein n=1 Tax=Pedobacter sp. BMA TaxID=1663685 RepID=UPI00064B22A3|nr:TMEM175 family protein [Pedobacter sp. BMA]KLT64310.1 TerC family integral membrane protein [Pedobacter sp. BMA]
MEKETGRIEAFSDGVFSIAVTLLVLDLHIPESMDGEHPVKLLEALKLLWPGYIAFIISFFSIFIIWVNHHKIFKQIYKRNTGLMFANGLILFLVSLVSYPSALLAKFYLTDSRQLSVTIYTGLFVAINIAFNLLWQQASSDRKLLRPGISNAAIARLRNNYLYGFPTYLSAFIISFFYPDLALAICVLLWIFWAASSKKINFTESAVTK